MASLYGVTPADVAAQLPGLFPAGFSVSTKPTTSTVQDLLDAADLMAQVEVSEATGSDADPADVSAVFAKKYLMMMVLAQVIRLVYTGNDPADVDRAAKPYELQAESYRLGIERLGLQGAGTVVESIERVRGGISQRDLLIDDTGLGSYTRPNTGGARPF